MRNPQHPLDHFGRDSQAVTDDDGAVGGKQIIRWSNADKQLLGGAPEVGPAEARLVRGAFS